jgi:hypothetical protein
MCLPYSCVATSAAQTHRERRLQLLFCCCVTSQRMWRVPLLRVYRPLPSKGCFSASTLLEQIRHSIDDCRIVISLNENQPYIHKTNTWEVTISSMSSVYKLLQVTRGYFCGVSERGLPVSQKLFENVINAWRNSPYYNDKIKSDLWH